MLRWWDGTQWTNHRCPVPISPQQGQSPQAGRQAPVTGSFYSGPPGGASDTFYRQSSGSSTYLTPAPSGTPSTATQSQSANRNRAYRTGGRTRGPNSFSWTAIGFAAAYLVIAATTNFVLLGIVPVISSIRAFQRGEKLAPIAAIAAVVTVGSALYFLTGGGHH
jgi:hypothetical protein